MPHETCAFSTFDVQNHMTVGAWLRSHQRSRAHGKATENRIAFGILSAVRLPWWVDAIVNLSGLYMADVILWRLRLRGAPLSLSPPLRDALEKLKEKTSRDHSFLTLNGLSERGNTPDLMARSCPWSTYVTSHQVWPVLLILWLPTSRSVTRTRD